MLLKGMTIQEYLTLVEYIQKTHPFAGMGTSFDTRKHIKYIDCIYDTRSQTVWSVSLRGLDANLQFRSNSFSHNAPPKDFKYYTLLEWVMAYLQGEWHPSAALKKEMHFA